MKKIASLFLALTLVLSLAACGDTASTDSSTVSQTSVSSQTTSEVSSQAPVSSQTETSSQADPAVSQETAAVAALKGPTAMGMVKLMNDTQLYKEGNLPDADPDDTYPFDFSIMASADEITPKLIQGELDIAAVPANLASILYQQTEGAVQVLAVNTLGVLYLVENGDSINTVEDLRGKTIYASGKGSTPEYALNYMLSANGIDPEKDVTIEWKSEHTECVAAITASENGIAMLPQPFVTTAQTKNQNLRVALDINKEWEALAEKDGTPTKLITGVVVARKAFVEENPALVETFLDEYEDSVEYVQENTAEAAKLVGSFDIVPEAVAAKALPQCNIVFMDGEEMKGALSSYLSVLYDQNPKAVGGALPADDFYYLHD